jgi:hypothetical protein
MRVIQDKETKAGNPFARLVCQIVGQLGCGHQHVDVRLGAALRAPCTYQEAELAAESGKLRVLQRDVEAQQEVVARLELELAEVDGRLRAHVFGCLQGQQDVPSSVLEGIEEQLAAMHALSHAEPCGHGNANLSGGGAGSSGSNPGVRMVRSHDAGEGLGTVASASKKARR